MANKSVTHLWEVRLHNAHDYYWVTTKTKRLKALLNNIEKLIGELHKTDGIKGELRSVEYRGTIDV